LLEINVRFDIDDYNLPKHSYVLSQLLQKI